MENTNKLVDIKKKLKIIRDKTANKKSNDIIQFYNDSLKLGNVTNGMVIVITDDFVIKEMASGKISHMRIAQEIFDTLPVNHIDLSKVEGDFGHTIAKEYHSIFIRMASILNGPTIIYYPEFCNEYQISKLEEFNSFIKEFNSSKKDIYKIRLEYNGRNNDDKKNLDELIKELKISSSKKKNTK